MNFIDRLRTPSVCRMKLLLMIFPRWIASLLAVITSIAMNLEPELYAKANHPQQQWARNILSTTNFLRGEYGRIIDVGCGTGEVTNIILQRFPHSTIVGIDKVSLFRNEYGNHSAISSANFTL